MRPHNRQFNKTYAILISNSVKNSLQNDYKYGALQSYYSYIIHTSMGNSCISGQKENNNDTTIQSASGGSVLNPIFTADVRALHQLYVKLVLHVRHSRLFQSRTDRLGSAVRKYFQSGFKFDPNDLDVASVDAVRKLHPKDYWHTKINEEWMIQSCLRQQKFSDETRVEKITYDHAYPEYLMFLGLCKHNIQNKTGQISVPTKCQDVIWHSHMQDPQKYRADMIALMGKLLNHMDDIPDEQLKKHSEATKKLTLQKYGPSPNNSAMGKNNNNTINNGLQLGEGLKI